MLFMVLIIWLFGSVIASLLDAISPRSSKPPTILKKFILLPFKMVVKIMNH